jgi:hypothetical protein
LERTHETVSSKRLCGFSLVGSLAPVLYFPEPEKSDQEDEEEQGENEELHNHVILYGLPPDAYA